ncbi:MAG: ubiquinone biosynthesis methyltransferase UbiE [Verrucomicrobiales bacterium]|nr:ubiquinone biosynthesis methyltransferase UbiE [Verrucomicrobiales bacterium]
MRYDLVNDIQSAGLHRLWKRKMAGLVALGESEQALDICCGTGDLIVRLAKGGEGVVGVDMNGAMLNVARRRLAKRNIGQSRLYQADALQLPFGDGQFDVVTIAYGLRNLADYKTGLKEIFRVLKPGGRLAILDFGKPPNRFVRGLYYQYLRWALPVFGWLFCGSPSAYAYILDSLEKYPAQGGVREMLSEIGFSSVNVVNILFGTMSLHIAKR